MQFRVWSHLCAVAAISLHSKGGWVPCHGCSCSLVSAVHTTTDKLLTISPKWSVSLCMCFFYFPFSLENLHDDGWRLGPFYSFCRIEYYFIDCTFTFVKHSSPIRPSPCQDLEPVGKSLHKNISIHRHLGIPRNLLKHCDKMEGREPIHKRPTSGAVTTIDQSLKIQENRHHAFFMKQTHYEQ